MSFLEKQFELLTRTPENTAKLKDLILQLAVQGKLVPQDPSDEPANVLLEKIKTEKVKLTKEGKIKKDKPLPPISEDEIPYELSDGWEWCRLKTITHNFGQKKPNRKFTYIDVSSVNNRIGSIDNNCQILLPEEAPSRARKIVKKNCVIYSTVRPYLLNITIIDRDFEYEPIVSTAFAVLNPILVNNKYFLFYLRSKVFTEYVEGQMIGMAYPAINDNKLYIGLIPLPPLNEQKRIVERVESLVTKVEKLEKSNTDAVLQRRELCKSLLHYLSNATGPQETQKYWHLIENNFEDVFTDLENVKELRKTCLQLAVQGKLVPQDPTDEPASVLLGKIKAEKEKLVNEDKIKRQKPLPPITDDEIPYKLPEGWMYIRMVDACIKITDGFHNTPKPTTKGFPYILATHVKVGRIDWDNCYYVSEKDHRELFRKAYPQKDELLLVNIGAGCGTPAIISVDFEFSFKNTAILKNSKQLYSRYLFYYLVSVKERVLNDIIQGGAQPYLSLKMIKNLILPLLSFNEQKRIVEKVDKLMELCDRLEGRIKESEEKLEVMMRVME